MTEPSLLERVAEHERGLLARLSAAKNEGRASVETATAQAAALLSEAHHSMERELSELRRKAGEERENERLEIESTTAAKVRTIHEDTATRREAVIAEILGLLLPKSHSPRSARP